MQAVRAFSEERQTTRYLGMTALTDLVDLWVLYWAVAAT